MDEVDKQILLLIDLNCRISYEEISRKIGLTANAVKKRMTKLVETGVIQEFGVLLSTAMTNAENFIAEIRTDCSENRNDFVEYLGNHQRIIQVGRLAGGEGGSYLIFAQYVGPQELLEARNFINEYEAVIEVDIHPYLFQKGSRFEFKKLHKLVLRHLVEKPRISAVEIARESGLTTRRVRRALREIEESGAIVFVTRWNLSAGESTHVFIRIDFDEKTTNRESLIEWLEQTFQQYWYTYISALKPTVFASFVVDHIRNLEDITREVRKHEGVSRVASMILFPVTKFPRIGHQKLMELLEDSEL